MALTGRPYRDQSLMVTESSFTPIAPLHGTLTALGSCMNKHRHNVTRVVFALCAMAGLQITGCSDSETPDGPHLRDAGVLLDADVSSAQTDGATSSPPAVDAGTPEDSCIRCPFEFGDKCEQPDLSKYPSRNDVIAEWRKSCPASITQGRCASSGLLYLQFDHGLGMERRYFDADGTFVGALNEVDLIDEQCLGKTEWPRHTPCDVSTNEVDACANTGPV